MNSGRISKSISYHLVPQKAEHIEFAYGKYIELPLGNISSLREQTYRVAFRQHIDLAEAWGLLILIKKNGFAVWRFF